MSRKLVDKVVKLSLIASLTIQVVIIQYKAIVKDVPIDLPTVQWLVITLLAFSTDPKPTKPDDL